MKATLLLMISIALSSFFFWCGFEAPMESRGEDLPALLEKVRSRYNLPAVAAACVTSDGICEVAAAGVRRNDGPEKVCLTDTFHLGSVTQSITALAIAQCVHEGLISWNTRPAAMFKELGDRIHPGYGTITLRSLLHHSAGVPAYTGDEEFERAPVSPGTGPERRRAFSIWLLQQPPAAEPGTFLYSNAGYAVATAMAEQATGSSWESIVRSKVFEPLGLESAGFGWPNRDDPHQPWGHGSFSGSDHCWPLGPDHEWKLNDLGAPAGDIHMSIEDLARYVQHHLRALTGRETALSADLAADLHTPYGSYGLGWFIEGQGKDSRSFHSGSAGTFLTSVEINPSRNMAVAFVCNARTDGATEACTIVMTKLMLRDPCLPCRFISETRN
ncbi:MAG: serine hydrolase domain-containing protein [Planctomycetota bacterium]